MDVEKLCEITRANLDLYSSQKRRIDTGELAHISLLCRHFCREKYADSDEARYRYSELLGTLNATADERRKFCSLLPQIAQEEQSDLFSLLFPVEKTSKKATVAYVKNPLSDRAFDLFGDCFDALGSIYGASFSDCAQSLFANECDCIILPIADSNGYFTHIFSLIDRYELHPVLCTCVYDELGEQESLFMLFSREVKTSLHKGRKYLDIILADARTSFAHLMNFADLLGITAHSVNTIGTSFDEGKAEIVFDITEKDYRPIIAYLLLEIQRVIIKGIYTEI